MKCFKIWLVIFNLLVMGVVSAQYQVPLTATGNAANSLTEASYSMISVTGQNVIGPVTGTQYHAYLGILGPVKHLVTDSEIREMSLFRLYQNYPNPFKEKTIITFEIPDSKNVRLTVFNVLGQPVEVILNKEMPQGKHLIEFDGSHLSPGMFFYTLNYKNYKMTKSMVRIK